MEENEKFKQKERLRLLAIDIGSKRMGIAIWNPEARMARALSPILRTKLRDDLQRIKALCQENKIEGLVVGIPAPLESEKSSSRDNAEFWLKTLKDSFELPVWSTDESLSTQEAFKILESKGLKKTSRRSLEKKDSLSAALFLEDFIRDQN